MAESCDCLNRCGDDERVGQYLVEPCAGELRSAQRTLARLQAEVRLLEDARRYRWLREMSWCDGPFAVVRNPYSSVRLGSDCPSRDLLDDAIDAEIAKAAING